MKPYLKLFIALGLSAGLSGCSLLPGMSRKPSAAETINYYLLFGASKFDVVSDFGNPDEIARNVREEEWTYRGRQKGKDFHFYFDKQGTLLNAQITDIDAQGVPPQTQ